MDPNKKKTLMMAGGAVGLLILVGALYYVFFMMKPAEPEEGAEGTLPEAEEAEQVVVKPEDVKGERVQINLIVDEPVTSPFLTPDGKILYFSKLDQYLHEVTIDGQNNRKPFPLSASQKPNIYPGIVDAKWNKAGSAALITMGDITGSIKEYGIFSLLDVANYAVNQDDKRIGPAAIAPFENRYLFQVRDTESNQGLLWTSEYDGKNAESLLAGGLIEMNLDWPSKDKISFYHRPSGVAQSNLFSYNLTSKTLKKILSSVSGLSVKWSPNGDNFLFSSTDSSGQNLTLKLGDEMGNTKELSIDQAPIRTIPEKCVFSVSEEAFYCAVMQNIPSDAILPDDHYKGLYTSKDALYRFYMESGKAIKVPGLDDNPKLPDGFNIEEMLLSDDNRFIFFVNKTDGYIYRFDLTVNPAK